MSLTIAFSSLPTDQEIASRFSTMKAMASGCSSRGLNMENSRFGNHRIHLQESLLPVNSTGFWKVLSMMKKLKKNSFSSNKKNDFMI